MEGRPEPRAERPRLWRWWLPALLPPLVWLAVLPRVGRLPANDYYGILPQVATVDGFVREPITWLTVKSNEHTVTLPTIVYAVNVVLTHGDNRALSGFALAMLGVELAALLALTAPRLRNRRAVGPAHAVLLAALVFTPAAAHSVVLGFSGTIWFLANALAVLAIAALARSVSQDRPLWLAAAVGFGLLGALSYSTNAGLWPALAVLAWLAAGRARWRAVAVIVGGAAAALIFQALLYSRPPGHPPPELLDLPLLAGYASAYLGGVLTGAPWPAAILGATGVASAAALAVLVVRGRDLGLRRGTAPWIALQVYAVINALGTAVARSGIGGALSSRYASVAALFWVGLAITASLVLAARGRERWRVLAIGGATILALATAIRGLPVLRAYLQQAARQPLAELALVHDVRDLDALEALSPAPDEVWRARELLVALGHVPFDWAPTVAYGEPLASEPGSGEPCVGVELVADGRNELDGKVLRLSGRARWPAGGRPSVVITGERCEVRGAGVAFPRGGLTALLSPGWPGEWSGYVRPATPDETLTAWILTEHGATCRLSPSWAAAELGRGDGVLRWTAPPPGLAPPCSAGAQP